MNYSLNIIIKYCKRDISHLIIQLIHKKHYESETVNFNYLTNIGSEKC